MGYTRQLKPKQKAQVRKIRVTKGVRAAISSAQRMRTRRRQREVHRGEEGLSHRTCEDRSDAREEGSLDSGLAGARARGGSRPCEEWFPRVERNAFRGVMVNKDRVDASCTGEGKVKPA